VLASAVEQGCRKLTVTASSCPPTCSPARLPIHPPTASLPACQHVCLPAYLPKHLRGACQSLTALSLCKHASMLASVVALLPHQH